MGSRRTAARERKGLMPMFGRILRQLLRVLPNDFRLRHGDEVAEYFSERSREIRAERGWLGVFRFWIRGSADVTRAAIAERIDHGYFTRPSQSQASRERQNPMNTIAQDIRFALRTMRRTPGFTMVTVVTFALGIGASVAMFGTTSAVLLKRLPFPEPERLVIGRSGGGGFVSGPDYDDFRDRSGAFENVGALMPFPMEYTITGGDEPERITGTAVSANLFSTIGVLPQLGSSFREVDGQEGANDVAVISHGFWQRRFGGDAGVVGTEMLINGIPFSILGIMPAGFSFLADVDFWRPKRPDRDVANLRDRHNWYMVGRLAQGTTIDEARIEADLIFSQLEAAYPETNRGKTLLLTDLHAMLVEDYRTRLFVLNGAVVLVLLIASANITGILLARAPARRNELSVRAALGASNSQLVRQMLAESAVLAGLGGAAGVALAVWLQRVILGFMQMSLPGLGGPRISMTMLCFALVLSLVVGIAAGIYPAVCSARGNIAYQLRAGTRASVDSGTSFRSGLVIAQVALSIVLLIGSALLIRSFIRVSVTDPGFDAENLLTAVVELPRTRYPEGEMRVQFFTRLAEAVAATPGVSSVGLTNSLPISGFLNSYAAYTSDSPDDLRYVLLRSVLPGFFESMRISILSGQDFAQRYAADAPPVTVIARGTAEAFFGDANPLGQRIVLDFFGTLVDAEVVGVVNDVRMTGLTDPPRPAVYMPYSQVPYSRMCLAVRAAVDPSSLSNAIRGAVRDLDSEIPVADITIMESAISESIADRKTVAFSLSLYAMLPLLLAAVGLYSVLAYYVSQRSHEIGLRMALGADQREVAVMILWKGALLLGLGVAIGVAGAIGLTRLLRQMLFGIEPTDPSTFVGVCVFVAAIALVACLVPAWRAVRVDPMVALQAE